ncbi:MAG: apolipoprotein N-acyltransferase [Planctomycetaceae bacterium]|jgi:apolipoprotein N-acyltransferase|nr:apolipoprotein N-acyltransferase [Planctomycetaceae bacterium]
MSLYLFFLGALIYCVLQFAYGSQICLAVFFVPLLWVPLITDRLVLKYRYVYLASFLFWFVSIFWISAPHPAAIIGLFVLSGYLSFYWLLFFLSVRSAVHFFHFPVIAAVLICWVGCEFLRNNMLGGFSFCSIEHLVYSVPVLIQIADIGGGYFVGGMIMSVGAGLGTILFASVLSKFCPNSVLTNNADKINVTKNVPVGVGCELPKFIGIVSDRRYGWRFIVTIIVTFLMIAGTIGYGYSTIVLKCNPFAGDLISDNRGGFELKIASLQGNAPVSVSMTNKQLTDCLKQYVDLTRVAADGGRADLDLIIWPETVCPIPYIIFRNGATYENKLLDRDVLDRGRNFLLNLSVEVGVPILYGLSTVVMDNNRNDKSQAEPLRLNSALLVVPNPPEFKSRYDKIQLVMFGEYVPFADYLPANFPLRSICQEACRGDKPVAIPLGNDIFASVNICFESTVPHHVRGQILSLKSDGNEPALLINLSNSGWFGFANQIDQHLATHVFRAVENRRPYVSAANCGYSATINCYGQITNIGKRQSAESVVDRLPIQYWTPLYHYIGDIPVIICMILTIFFILYPAYKKLKLKFFGGCCAYPRLHCFIPLG